MSNYIYIIYIFVILTVLSCKDEIAKPKYEPTINLFFEDASCTEVWLKLVVTNVVNPTVEIKRDDSLIATYTLTSIDTTIIDKGLFPNRTYTYYAIRTDNGEQSNTVTATTLDTTRSNFSWQSWTFGEHSSSVLYDVAIIDENNIWAVGEIYINNYTGQADPNAFNAVHWDGNKWELKRITVNFRGNMVTLPLEGIISFSPSDIWCVGSLPIYGDGQNWNIVDLRSMYGFESVSLSKAWGTSSSSIYFVGGNGSLVYYNGIRWRKIESGTQLSINDIWGSYNTQTGVYEILAVASNKYFNEGKKVLAINGTTIYNINDSGLSWSLSSVWFIAGRKYYICGDGLYPSKTLSGYWQRDTIFPAIYKDKVRGRRINDVVVSGSNGLLSHYNGVNWYHYLYNELPPISGRLLSVDINGNEIAAVGVDKNKAIIILGKR